MTRRGQLGIIGVVFGLLMFLIVWALFLGAWLQQIGADAIANNGLTGIEAFAWANLNLWVWIGVGIAVLAYTMLGGGQ